ncbi:14783_t:CDS:1, partial [Funneliformis geosporum]
VSRSTIVALETSAISSALTIEELAFTIWDSDVIISSGLEIDSMIEIFIPAFWRKSTILQPNKRQERNFSNIYATHNRIVGKIPLF